MSNISVLPKEISQLIAAGEVVDRPSSIVKELIENSIDAKATIILIEIENGGKKLIKVKDNGIGMSSEDVKVAFLRHSTSKIKSKLDLDNIKTLGFRGEALASIAAVSKVEVITKREQDEFGTKYTINGGEPGILESFGSSDGTTFIIKDLFYNIPARMKFLKKDSTESNSIFSMVDKIALSHPDITFLFIKDGKECLHTPGDGNLISTIVNVFNKNAMEEMIKVDFSDNYMKMSGYISKPPYTRSNRLFEHFYINGRYINSKICSIALENSYKNLLMTLRYPMCVLNIEISPDKYDINVHPSKMDVKFEDENRVFNFIYVSIKTLILEAATNVDKNITFENRNKFLNFNEPSDASKENKSENFMKVVYENSENKPDLLNSLNLNLEENNKEVYNNPANNGFFGKDIVKNYESKNNDLVVDNISLVDGVDFKIIGEIFNTYILVEISNDVYMIDKHAAHERVLYENVKRNFQNITKQTLIETIIIELSKDEYDLVLNNIDLISQSGFEIEDFGSGSIIIRAIPIFLQGYNIKDIFLEISNNLYMHSDNISYEKLEWLYESISCRGAIKANDKNDILEKTKLVQDIIDLNLIKYCPHGRPIIIKISKNDIEKIFGRH